ncbi:DNA repair protein RadA [Methylocapsa palsarum]|uniref:DNA repair protein RadA n=1 Tax=Methylocapsa palsarum TaxID=1612308 RepID=A0A1I3WZL8_9HYPH|nr:DNA repair protein RadA [Methylocapsa palsarum]SFK12357.1 DNA repair protein RadA/Sms [Methylocapsa palsarum]
MAKPHASFVCQACGAATQRWQGRCESCGSWNTIIEEAGASGIGARAALGAQKGRIFSLANLTGAEPSAAPRITTGVAELDRVTGGGFVPGSVLLLGGEPGIGKSTLLIQACAALASGGRRVVYISGEEAVDQVRLRAQRLGLGGAPVELAAETSVEDIVATLAHGKRPSLVVIDSIQTMWTQMVESTPGTVGQVRGAAQALIRFAKTTGAVVILVGHVTKDGQIAGPRVVEHMVDAVVSFEGEGGRDLRLLRAVKNRFGPTDEIGVFEMTGRGLAEVANPSALFLSSRENASPGAAVFAGMEGTRPLLVEIQALVAPSSLGTPRRAVVGWDGARLAMVLAVLEAHGGLRLGQHDIYLSVAGGLRVGEPAADLAAAAALISSLSGVSLPSDSVFFGEIALSGAIRPVAHAAARLKEAGKLGFGRATTPQEQQDRTSGKSGAPAQDLTVATCKHISELVAEIAKGTPERTRSRRGD